MGAAHADPPARLGPRDGAGVRPSARQRPSHEKERRCPNLQKAQQESDAAVEPLGWRKPHQTYMSGPSTELDDEEPGEHERQRAKLLSMRFSNSMEIANTRGSQARIKTGVRGRYSMQREEIP